MPGTYRHPLGNVQTLHPPHPLEDLLRLYQIFLFGIVIFVVIVETKILDR
jgi:hypothetical protein